MARLQTEYVELAGVRLAYTQHDQGRPLLMLHGNSESKRIFAKYQTEYFRNFRTIAIDSRGHGQSESYDLSFSIEQYADDVIDFCEKVGITKASVIGYSDGGNIALFLAHKAPEVFERIVAISPNYLVSGTTDGALRFFRAVIRIMELLGRIGFKTQKSVARFNLMMRDIGLSDEDLRGVRTKVAVLYAEKDLIKEDHIKRIAELIPNTRLVKISRCNHLNILQKAEAVQEMQTWLFPSDSGPA